MSKKPNTINRNLSQKVDVNRYFKTTKDTSSRNKYLF